MNNSDQIAIRITFATRVLCGIALLFGLAYLGTQIAKYVFGHPYLMGTAGAVDLDAELNLPAYFSLLLLAFASQLLLLVALLAHRAGERHVTKWVVLSIGFLLMGFDEGFSVHEQLSRWLHDRIHGEDTGLFHFTWVMPASVLVMLLGFFFLKFLRDLPAATRWRFVAAGMVYVGCAVGVEMIEGWYVESRHLGAARDLTYSLMVLVEEIGEMMGVVLFIRALLLHCARYHAEVRLRFET